MAAYRRDTGSSANLPSSHGGGVLPGNHSGLSGSAAAQTATDLELEGAANLLTLSFLPPKNEALVAPTTDPFFCELHHKFCLGGIFGYKRHDS